MFSFLKKLFATDKRPIYVGPMPCEIQEFLPMGSPRSGKWPAVRNKVLEERGVCLACGCTDHTILSVHHIKPFHLFPELELEPTNLVVLCEGASLNCHFAFGHLLDWKAYNPEVIKDASRFFVKKKNRLYTSEIPQKLLESDFVK